METKLQEKQDKAQKTEQKQEQKEGQKQPLLLPAPANADEKQKLLQMSEIGISLDTYDDIFSDFDPRPYALRSISDDFLFEAKKASKERPTGQIELSFLMPKDKRSSTHEATIKKRLKDHFKKHAAIKKNEYKKAISQGLYFAGFGIILMLVTSYILFKYPSKNFLISFFIILMEPSSWFLFWEGTRQVVFESKEKKPDADFYKKMSASEIKFVSY